MGVRDITDEFRRSARKSFRDLQRALNDKYCWKCPQRTVRSITGCRELDAWVRLREALEEEVSSFISEILGEEALDRVKTRMRERKLRRELRILKINDEYLIAGRPVGLVSGDLIIIGSDIHILRGLDGVYAITDDGRHPLHAVEGKVLDRIGSNHPLHDYIRGLGRI